MKPFLVILVLLCCSCGILDRLRPTHSKDISKDIVKAAGGVHLSRVRNRSPNDIVAYYSKVLGVDPRFGNVQISSTFSSLRATFGGDQVGNPFVMKAHLRLALLLCEKALATEENRPPEDRLVFKGMDLSIPRASWTGAQWDQIYQNMATRFSGYTASPELVAAVRHTSESIFSTVPPDKDGTRLGLKSLCATVATSTFGIVGYQ